MLDARQFVAIAALLTLTACGEADGSPGKGIAKGGAMNNADVGTTVGALGGAIISWQFGGGTGQLMATVGGGLLGGILGDAVGTAMDEEDMKNYKMASQHAMRTGTITQWQNTKSGNYGDIAPSAAFKAQDGRECREYKQNIVIDNKLHDGMGTACRIGDGDWQVVKPLP